MKITTEQKRRALVVRIDGELDLHTSPLLQERVAAALTEFPNLRVLVVVLSNVTFIDSSGLGALLACYRDLSALGKRFVLANPQAAVRRVLQMSGILSKIDVVDSEAQAVLRL